MAGLVEQSFWSSEGNTGSSVPPRDGHCGPKLGGRAVVIGAGMGGLAAAGALAQYFERVDILERDQLTASIGSRSGTPQDRHPHGLLAGGLRALEQIFPGFKRDLAAAGAVRCEYDRGQDAMDYLPSWVVTIAAVVVGLCPGLAILSVGPVVRLLDRALWPRPEIAPERTRAGRTSVAASRG